MKSVRILCAADLHLGRRLAKLPEGLEELAQAPKLAWANLVECALDASNRIDAVILAGDIFDNEQNLYEAIGVFEKGLRRILACKIPVIAVAGNHDGQVLTRLSTRLQAPDFHLLGKNESWESVTLTFHGRFVRFMGWSFASSRYLDDPLACFPEESGAALTVGILHCDVDGGKKSVYAPVELRRFQELSPKAWVLGHVHIPVILSKDPLVCYCGSLQGLDPSEAGERGAVLLDILPSQEIVHTSIPLAPLLFHSQPVDLSDSSRESLDGDLCMALRNGLGELKGKVKAVLCRFILQGRSRFYRELRAFAERIEGRDFTQISRHVGGSGVPCFVESVSNACMPAMDVDLLCGGRDFVAIIAHLIKSAVNEEFLTEAADFLRTKIEKNGQLEIEPEVENLLQPFVHAGYEVLDMIFSQEEV